MPIVVLTGQVLDGVVDELEIAHAIARFGLVFSEKPLPHVDPAGNAVTGIQCRRGASDVG